MFSDAEHEKWKETRQRKSRYVLTHGVLMWTLVSIAFYVIEIDFDVEQFRWLGLGLRLLVAIPLGALLGHLSYQRRERIYQKREHRDV